MRTPFFAVSLILFNLLLTFSPAHADALTPQNSYYPAGFYQTQAHDDDLKNELFAILSSAHLKGTNDTLINDCEKSTQQECYQHHALGYNPARKLLFGTLHLQKTQDGYGVMDVYCEVLKTEKDFSKNPPGPGKIPDSAVMNTEHTWPQSHFTHRFPIELQKSDLHILYPVSESANSSRSNLDFSDVVTMKSSPCAKAHRGFTNDGTSQQFFEPPANHKGNVARAVFYYSIRYQTAIPAEEEASLRAWNKMDPPDDFERGRNDAIMALQGDRNPFIDYPELIDLISEF